MNYLRTALPWLLFAGLAAVSWPASAGAGLLACSAGVNQARRAGTAWEDLIFQLGSLAFFAVDLVLALAAPHSGLRPYSGAESEGWLALTAWFSLAVGKPFTTAYAKADTPPEIWNEPRFKKVNKTITTFWAGSFTVFAILIALAYAGTRNSGAAGLVQLIGLAVPALLTVRYAARARARAGASAASAV
jgi:hypothetical protein